MAPTYVDRGDEVDDEVAKALYEAAADPRKPWTIVAEIEEEHGWEHDRVRHGLRVLTLRGTLTINADGGIRQFSDAYDEW